MDTAGAPRDARNSYEEVTRQMSTVQTRRATEHRRALRQTLSAYARLSNVKVYFQWMPAVVGWSLSTRPFGLSGSGVAGLVLFVLAWIATTCAAGALDDIQGLRDGLDVRTYAADDALRSTSGKPLVTGELTEEAAYRFALVVGGVGLGLGVVALLVAPYHPAWLIVGWLVAAYAATQYSYGIKLSYRGAGELLLAVEASIAMLVALLLLTGAVTRTGWFEAGLIGTLFAQVTVFSSSQDADIDRAAGRMTLAARLSQATNRRLIALVFAAGWSMTAVGFATAALKPWLALALLPMWGLQIAQLITGVGSCRWLLARHLGWRAFDAGLFALVAVNLLTG